MIVIDSFHKHLIWDLHYYENWRWYLTGQVRRVPECGEDSNEQREWNYDLVQVLFVITITSQGLARDDDFGNNFFLLSRTP